MIKDSRTAPALGTASSPNSNFHSHSSPVSNSAILIKRVQTVDMKTAAISTIDLLIEDGKIAAIAPQIILENRDHGADTTIDGNGLTLLPGLVDLRVQSREPGFEHEETFATLAKAAVAGGITSLACLANNRPICDEPALIAMISQISKQLQLARLYGYGAVTKGCEGVSLAEMGLMNEAGAIGFSDSPNPIGNSRLLSQALTYAKSFDGLIMTHPEEPTLATGAMNQGETATRLGLAGSSAVSELIQIQRDLALAEATAGRLHIGPITTAVGVAAIRNAKARGVAVTCDTAPHYLLLNETAVGAWRSFAKVVPPLRAESDRQALLVAVADGTIDVLTSDHAPRAADSKRVPFAQAAFGIVGLETLLPLSLSLMAPLKLSLAKIITLLSFAPAAILRLPNPSIRVGAMADLTLVDLDQSWTIVTEQFHSRSKNSPFDGHTVQGRVKMTIVAGKIVYDDGIS